MDEGSGGWVLGSYPSYEPEVPKRATLWATYAIIAVNVIVYLITTASNGFLAVSNRWVEVGGFAPILLAVDPINVYRFFTSMFLHGDIFHIFFNMYFLYLFGRGVEGALGSKRYLALYFLSGIAAAIFHTAYSYLLGGAQALMVPAIGASGAISGVLGAYLILYPGTKLTACTWFILPICFTLYSAYFLLFWFAFQVFYGYTSVGAGIAFMAHAGGFVAGIALLGMLADRRRIKLLRTLSSGGSLFGFIRYVFGGIQRREGLSAGVKIAVALLIFFLGVGALAGTLYSIEYQVALDVAKVSVSIDGAYSVGYVFYQWDQAGPVLLGRNLVDPSVRVLLNRLYAAGLLYNPVYSGERVEIVNKMLRGTIPVCGTPITVIIYVDKFVGTYDSRGLLVEGYGTIRSPIITVIERPFFCRYEVTSNLYRFDFSLVTYVGVNPTPLALEFNIISLVLSLVSLYVVLWRDKDLVITPVGAPTAGSEGFVPL